MVIVRSFIVTVFLLISSECSMSSEVPKNVLFLVELPLEGRFQALKQLKSYYQDVLFRRKLNYNFAFSVIDSDIVTVTEFQCNDYSCKLRSLQKLSDLKFKRVSISGSSNKQNLVANLKELESSIFSNTKGQKIIVVMLSTELQENLPLSEYTKSLLENGYEIIVVGIDKGQTEDLLRIVFEDNRIVRLNSFKDLNEKKNKELINNLIDNPNYRDPFAPQMSANPDSVTSFDANEYVPTEEICSYAADIAFIIDSSYSIKLDYQKELMFVQRIASRFGISETGSHAGVIIFSDGKNYTKVTIKLNDYKNTKEFNKAVSRSDFIGYRTRIDYAFQKAEKELFTDKGGARPTMPKIIFLVTDGKQNPKVNKTTNVRYDPIKESQSMYDNGVKIFVVGIGQDLDRQQLEDIARDKTKVYYANTIDTLISDDFVKSFSKKLCVPGNFLKRNVTTSKPPCNVTKAIVNPCGGVGPCSSCCGSRDIYINIFQPNAGPKYIMQGMKLTSGSSFSLSGNKESAMKPTVDLKMQHDPKYVMNILKGAIPQNTALLNSIQSLLTTKYSDTQPDGNVIHRKRRDVENIGRSFNDTKLIELAKLAGCNLFFKALDKYNLLRQMIMKKHVTFFCPIDSVFQEMYQLNKLSIDEKQLLLNHVAFNYDNDGTMYRTLSNDGKIVLSKRYGYAGRPMWYANEVPVLLSFANGNNNKIILIKDFIKPRLNDTQSILKSDSNLSIFYDLWKRSSVLDNLDSRRIQKICFTQSLCASVTKVLQDHLHKALRFHQFTILAPENEIFFKMDKKYFKSIYKNESALREFMQEHVYLGLMGQQNLQGQISHSLSPEHSIITTGIHDNKIVLVDAKNRLLKVERSIQVKEGILHVIKDIE